MVAVVAFAVQVLTKVVVLQVMFGFENEALLWQAVSAVVIGLIVSAVVSTCRQNQKKVLGSSTWE